ncbi:MAG TPA: GNAT family N-acetyltransferase [Pyrinomonadaceae bacterium]|jgi:ribosomal protein S18 acetylase RimI-like enzyme
MTEHSEQEISLRLAGEGDVDALVGFNRAMARETEAKELSVDVLTAGVGALIRNPSYGFYVVAEAPGASGAEDEIVGSLLITYEWSDWRNALFWWIQSVYVREDFRRRGVYRRLYAFVKERAAAEGNVCGFRLYVEKQNLVAQQTYQRLGMAETYYKMFEELSEGSDD